MEEERKDALEMEEKAQEEAQEGAEAQGRKAVAFYSSFFFFLFLARF
jgi:hypothetical protein